MIKILTDSSSDILQAEAKELGIILIPLTITFEDGKSYLDEVEIKSEEFYSKLATCKKPPFTSQLPLLTIEEEYEKARKEGYTLIAMPLSSKLSGSYHTAVMVKNQGNYDNVHVVDTLATASFLKLLVFEANKVKDKMSPEKLVQWIEELRQKTRLFAMIDTLEYLRKGGRLNNAQAFIGGLLHFKPCVGVVDGTVTVLSKQIGQAKAIAWIKDKIKNLPIDYNYPVYYQFTGSSERTMQLIEATSPNPAEDKKKAFFVGPVVGTHIGPGAMVITYVIKCDKAPEKYC
jgi:DegV family protein with EDD domain